MKVIASIQARMGSTRLPGKVLLEAAGRPLLQWQVMRLRQSLTVDEVVLATTTSSQDDILERWCKSQGVTCYRGSEQDVLSRVAGLIDFFGADVHVECFGDSPLIDPQIVDQFVAMLFKNQNSYDFVSSNLKTTYPPGFEVLAYFGNAMRIANELVSSDDPLREHAGYNLTRFPEQIRTLGIEAPAQYFAPDTYLEVDTVEDFVLVRAVLEHFHKRESVFGLGEVLDFVQTVPHLTRGNQQIERRWREFRSDV